MKNTIFIAIIILLIIPLFSGTFAVKKVEDYTYLVPDTHACPITLYFGADITTNGPGEVTYRWIRNDGFRTGSKTLRFDAAGTKSIKYKWQMTVPHKTSALQSVQVQILSPNRLLSDGTGAYVFCWPR